MLHNFTAFPQFARAPVWLRQAQFLHQVHCLSTVYYSRTYDISVSFKVVTTMILRHLVSHLSMHYNHKSCQVSTYYRAMPSLYTPPWGLPLPPSLHHLRPEDLNRGGGKHQQQVVHSARILPHHTSTQAPILESRCRECPWAFLSHLASGLLAMILVAVYSVSHAVIFQHAATCHPHVKPEHIYPINKAGFNLTRT